MNFLFAVLWTVCSTFEILQLQNIQEATDCSSSLMTRVYSSTAVTCSSSMPIFDVSTRLWILSHMTSCASRTQAAGPVITHTRSVVPVEQTGQ